MPIIGPYHQIAANRHAAKAGLENGSEKLGFFTFLNKPKNFQNSKF